MACDYRSSRVDSEWSYDGNEMETQYFRNAVPAPAMYDLPPDATARFTLPSVGDEEDETKAKYEMKSKKDQCKDLPKFRSSRSTRCWVKVYFALLTILVLAIGGLFVFTMLKKGTASSNTDLADLQAELTELKGVFWNMKNIWLNISKEQVQSNYRPVEKGDAGCVKGHLEFNSRCYAVKLGTTGVTQLGAAFECLILKGTSGKLAMIKTLAIQEALSEYLPENAAIWIDGSVAFHRQNNTEFISFSDKTSFRENTWRSFTGSGKCVSIKSVHETQNIIRWERQKCDHQLEGYVCQYLPGTAT